MPDRPQAIHCADLEIPAKVLKKARHFLLKAEHEHEWHNPWKELSIVFNHAKSFPQAENDALQVFVHDSALSFMYQCLHSEVLQKNQDIKQLWQEKARKINAGAMTSIMQELANKDEDLYFKIFAYLELTGLVALSLHNVTRDPLTALEFAVQEYVAIAYAIPDHRAKAFLAYFTLDVDDQKGKLQIMAVNLHDGTPLNLQ